MQAYLTEPWDDEVVEAPGTGSIKVGLDELLALAGDDPHQPACHSRSVSLLPLHHPPPPPLHPK